MSKFTATIKVQPDPGLENLISVLSDPKAVYNLRRGAARASGVKILEAVEHTVPKHIGTLANTVRLVVKKYRGDPEAVVAVGSRLKVFKGGQMTRDFYKTTVNGRTRYHVAYYAGWVEYGTRPHTIFGPVKLGNRVFSNVRHPGAKATKFMQRAAQMAESKIGPTYDAFWRNTVKKLEAKTAGLPR